MVNLSADSFRTSTGSPKLSSLKACWTRIPTTLHYTRPFLRQICSQFKSFCHTRMCIPETVGSVHISCKICVAQAFSDSPGSGQLSKPISLQGFSCLMMAASQGHVEVLQLLLAYTNGINVDVKNHVVSTDALREQWVCCLRAPRACAVDSITNGHLLHIQLPHSLSERTESSFM